MLQSHFRRISVDKLAHTEVLSAFVIMTAYCRHLLCLYKMAEKSDLDTPRQALPHAPTLLAKYWVRYILGMLSHIVWPVAFYLSVGTSSCEGGGQHMAQQPVCCFLQLSWRGSNDTGNTVSWCDWPCMGETYFPIEISPPL
jgi:hypothetical protein